MKIQNGAPSQLIEQMRKAHAERKAQLSEQGGQSFKLQEGQQANQATAPSEMESSLMSIARQVVDGKLNEPVAVRRQVIEVIVDQKYGALIDPAQKKQTLSILEYTLGDDPQFAREVDNMLILAAQQLAGQGS